MTTPKELVIIHFEDWEWWFVDGRREYSGRHMDTGRILNVVSKLGPFTPYRFFVHDFVHRRTRAEDLVHTEPNKLRDFLLSLEDDEFHNIWGAVKHLNMDGNQW